MRPQHLPQSAQKTTGGNVSCRDSGLLYLAVAADSVLKKGMENELKCRDLVPDFVELCLTEWMLFAGRGWRFLARILGSSDEELANEGCRVNIVLLGTASVKGSSVFSYQCDGCSLFPISIARYSLPEAARC